MKKLFLWTFVLTLLCTWAVVGADQTPKVPIISSQVPDLDREPIKAQKGKGVQEMISGSPLTTNAAPAASAVPTLEKEEGFAEPQGIYGAAATQVIEEPYKPDYTGPINVPDQNVILQGGDVCAQATVIPGIPYNADGSTIGYTDDYEESCFYSPSTSPDVVYSYTPEVDIAVNISLCQGQTDYDTKLYVYEDVCQVPDDGQEPYACNDDFCPDPYLWVSYLECVQMNVGHTYYIVVDGYGGGSGNYNIDITECVPATGACCVEEVCVFTSEEQPCLDAGGDWYEGESCPDFECPGLPQCSDASVWDNGVTDGINGYRPTLNWDPLGIIDDFQFEVGATFNCVRVEIIEGTTPMGQPSDIMSARVRIYNAPNGLYALDWPTDGPNPLSDITYQKADGSMEEIDSGDDYWSRDLVYFDLCGEAVSLGPGNYGIFVTFPGRGPDDFFWSTATNAHGNDAGGVWGPDVPAVSPTAEHAWHLGIGTCEDLYGACCDDETGFCEEDVLSSDCPPPLRFAANTLCDDLIPPCQAATGACCDEGVTGDCVDALTAAECEDAGYARWEEGVPCEILEPPCEEADPTQKWSVQQLYRNQNPLGFTAHKIVKRLKGKVDIKGMRKGQFANVRHRYFPPPPDETILVWEGGNIPNGGFAYACFSTKNGKKVKPKSVYWWGRVIVGGRRGWVKWPAGQPIGGGDDVNRTTSLSIEVSNDWYSDSLGSDIITGSEVYWAEVPDEYSLDELNESLFDDPSISWESLPGFALAYESDSLYTFDDLTDDYYVLFRFLAEGTFDIPPVTELWQIPTTMARGACCDYSTGECQNDILQSECDGRFATDMLCSELDPPCGEAVGACCFDDGDCEELTAVACTDQGGYFLGAFTSCDPINPCWQPTPICMENSLFDQPPVEPEGGWNAVDSDIGGPYTVYEDFAVDDDFYRIRFWGISLSDLSEECVEEPMTFEIKFYPDDGFGYPDLANPACTTYTPELWGTPTGLLYGDFMLYEWQVDLYEACSLGEGWISIRGISIGEPTDCQFLWVSHNEAGDGFSYQHQGESFVSYDFDVSLCLSVDCGAGVGLNGLEFDGFQAGESDGGHTTLHIRVKGGKPGQQIMVWWYNTSNGTMAGFPLTIDRNGEASKDWTIPFPANDGDTDILHLYACNQEVDAQPGRWEGNSAIRVPYDCVYIPGDPNCNGIPAELPDAITMIGNYRGTVPHCYECDCPPHGEFFAPHADPNGNCISDELPDVVSMIGIYRGTVEARGCDDCPGQGLLAPGRDGTLVVPSLKSKIKINKGNMEE